MIICAYILFSSIYLEKLHHKYIYINIKKADHYPYPYISSYYSSSSYTSSF